MAERDDASSIASYNTDMTLVDGEPTRVLPRSVAPSYHSTDPNQSSPLDRSDEDTIISIKIPAVDLLNSGDESGPTQRHPERRKSWIDKFKPKSSSSAREEIVMVTRGDYRRYWARDQDGRYVGTEPEGTGRRLLSMKKQGLSAGNEDRKSNKAEDRFGQVEGTVSQALGYGSYMPEGQGWRKENKMKRLQEGVDMQRR